MGSPDLEGADLVSRAVYLNGLVRGLDLATTSEEGRILEGVVGLLEDMARQVWLLSAPQSQDLAEGTLAENVAPQPMPDWTLPAPEAAREDLDGRPVFLACECPRCGEDVFVQAGAAQGYDGAAPEYGGEVFTEGAPREFGVTCENCGEAIRVSEQPSAGEWMPVNASAAAPESLRPWRRAKRSPDRPGPGRRRHARQPRRLS